MIIKYKNISEKNIELNINKHISTLKSIYFKFKRINLNLLFLLKNYSANVDPKNTTNKYTNEVISLLDNLINYLTITNESINLIKKSIKFLQNIHISVLDRVDLENLIEKYNLFINENYATIIANYKNLNKFLKDNADLLKNKFKMSANTVLEENILIISEKNNKVILPYTLREIKDYIVKKNDFNISIEDVIENVYTVPLSNYRNSIKSRFKESYKLIRNKENGSIKDALDLAFEMAFNFKLHPAIITACKNVSELDIYLACLEYNELDDFRYFKTRFEISPTNITKTVALQTSIS